MLTHSMSSDNIPGKMLVLRQVIDHILFNPQGYMEIYLRPQARLVSKEMVFYLNSSAYLPLFVHIPTRHILYADTSRLQSLQQYVRTHRFTYAQVKWLLEACGTQMRDLGQAVCLYQLEEVFIEPTNLEVYLASLPLEVPDFSVNRAFQSFALAFLENADLNVPYETISQWYLLLKSQSFTIDFFLNTFKTQPKRSLHFFSFWKRSECKSKQSPSFYDAFHPSPILQEDRSTYLSGQATTELSAANKTQLLVHYGCLQNEDGQSIPLQADFHIGRESDNDLVLADANVSRHHARIYAKTDGLYLEDLASTNGTWLNEEKQPLEHAHHLQEGDRLRIGQTILIYHGST